METVKQQRRAECEKKEEAKFKIMEDQTQKWSSTHNHPQNFNETNV